MSGFLVLKRCLQRSSIKRLAEGTGSGKDVVNAPKPVPPPPPPGPTDARLDFNIQKFEPTKLDRIFLVWSGHYKSKDEIPRVVDKAVLERSRSWSRIRINLGFMVVALVGSFYMVHLGKQAAKRGETVESRNKAWHKKINEEHMASLAASELKKAS